MLVVAPSSVCPVWPSEFRKFGAFPSRVAVLQGDKNKRLAALRYVEAPAMPGQRDPLRVAVINYESTWRLEDELKAYAADLIVCDESQRMCTTKAVYGESYRPLMFNPSGACSMKASKGVILRKSSVYRKTQFQASREEKHSHGYQRTPCIKLRH